MPAPKARYDAIYLSPHLDDAVLSCGGSVAAQLKRGDSVLIATVAAGDPPPGPLAPLAHVLHASWRLGRDAVARRRTEDEQACRVLGADWIHWPVADCIYRRSRAPERWRYASHHDIFGPVHPEDDELLAEICSLLAALPACRRLFAPLGIGGHVDHQLVRRAAETQAHPALSYYADQPYCGRDPAPLADMRARADWIEDRVTLEDGFLETKLAAVRAYASQAPKLFPGGFDRGSPGRRDLSGESFWRKR